jgi:lipid-binding SYLF domain-containing protein
MNAPIYQGATMNRKHIKRLNAVVYALLAHAAFVHGVAQAQEAAPAGAAAPTRQEATATRHVTNAVAVVRKLEKVDRMQDVLKNARGIFIVPSYGRVAAGVGAAGGTGLLLVRHAGGDWTGPVFYNTGGLSVGLQVGAEGGNLVLILNNDKALDEFMKKNNVAINAKAGLTVLDWNKMVQGSAGTGDVTAWSDTKGLLGDAATVEVKDIRFNQKMTTAYYRRTLSAADVIDGKTTSAQSAPLFQALAAASLPAR